MKSRVDAAEADLTLINDNGAKDEVQRWNTELEARLDDIEASLATIRPLHPKCFQPSEPL